MKPTLILITAAVSLLTSPRESAAQQKPPAKGLVIVAPLRAGGPGGWPRFLNRGDAVTKGRDHDSNCGSARIYLLPGSRTGATRGNNLGKLFPACS
jgi:hypothetical protein